MKIKNKQKVEVEIYGQTFILKSEETNPDYILQIAQYVDNKMKEIASKVGMKISLSHLSILVALNIADELFQEKQKKGEDDLIIVKTRQLIQLLDDGILGDPII